MSRKKGTKKDKPDRGGQAPRRGMRRSIRHEAVEEWPEDRLAAKQAAREEGMPPEIMVRKLQAVEALERLEFQIRSFARQGQNEVLVVHGKGQGSPGGVSVLGPLVRQWCDDCSHLVDSWREAPDKWGGSGAIVVVLKKGSS
jgi:dsDNA-specific endonuclease/ATPase MutS2